MEHRAAFGQALVVGCPGANLQGVDHDVRCMADMLAGRGFAVDVRTGDRATRAGILAGYDELIARIEPDQAAVFYYSGHGFHAFEPTESAPWQGISPADIHASSDTDFRGITSWELSIKLVQLTQRTKNVTVILDCCHAAQMSRDAAVHKAVPKALPHPFRRGFAAHLRALRDSYGAAADAVHPLGNPDAVRLVACGQRESAYEYPGADGQYRGAFTEALLEVLNEVDRAPLAWAAIDDAIRRRVRRRSVIQRPAIEGPVRRHLFSLDEGDAGDTIEITATRAGFRLGAGHLQGILRGDVYAAMPSGARTYRAAAVIAEVKVSETSATFADATLCGWRNGHAALPRYAVAIAVEKVAARHPVRIDVPDSAQAEVNEALGATRTLRRAEPDEASALPMLRLRDGALTIEDPLGPLFPAGRFPADLPAAVENLANLGVAQAIRALGGEHGVLESELEIEWGAVDGGRMCRMPECGGALALGDRIYVKVRSLVPRPLFAHVFNVGLRGKVTLLTGGIAPAGVALTSDAPDLEPAPELVLGQRPDGALLGLGLSWPDRMPRATFPRIDELVVIITSERADLRCLETVEHIAAARGAGSKLEDLLGQLQDGRSRSMRSIDPIHGFLVKRLWYFLHPRDAVMANTQFEIDDNPLRDMAARSAGAWITPDGPAAALQPATVIAIELADLVIENRRAVPGQLRLDAVVCTRTSGEAAGYSAWTQRCADVNAGGRPTLGSRVVFRGPVRDFVELSLWISVDSPGSLDLAQLLARRAATPALRDAASALRIGAGTAAVPLAAAAGASAVVTQVAFELLRGTGGQPIGLYRGSFVAHERFGVGRGAAAELQSGRDLSWRLVFTLVRSGGGDRAAT